jgi:hypothetical protein
MTRAPVNLAAGPFLRTLYEERLMRRVESALILGGQTRAVCWCSDWRAFKNDSPAIVRSRYTGRRKCRLNGPA